MTKTPGLKSDRGSFLWEDKVREIDGTKERIEHDRIDGKGKNRSIADPPNPNCNYIKGN